jgi:transposase InsO family protein
MEEQWIVDRSKLRAVWLEHPEWSKRQLAEAVGRSQGWVKKWLKRIRSSPLEDQQVLQGQSRARKHLPPAWSETVVHKILEIRDNPPKKLGRSPGPLTILYYLNRDESLVQAGVRLPRSTRTIWKILDRSQRILRPSAAPPDPEERPAPGVEWGMDFHDVSCVPAHPDGKQRHVVEILNVVDHGSSAVVASQPGGDYTAETALRTVAEVLVAQGCPDRIRMDRDTRWVGSWTAKDFPSPLLRFLQCLGIEPKICPPQTPQKNPFVERYHRNYKYECQNQEQPQDLESTIATNEPYVHFYNYERPNQAITCGNLPPRVKFPKPPQLSPVPETIDPDRWLSQQTGKTYTRRLDRNGTFQLGNQTYYVQQKLQGRSVTIWVDGTNKVLEIYVGRQAFKKIPIKGLQNRLMDFPAYLELICQEAVSTWRRLLRRTPIYP